MKVTGQLLLSLTVPLAFLLLSTSAGASTTYAASTSACNWRVVSSPNPSSQTFNSLNAVAAVSASDIWAVGSAYLNGTPNQAIIEHWNGTKWATISSPSPGAYSYLNGVAAVSTAHVWAVGEYYGGTVKGKTLVETRC